MESEPDECIILLQVSIWQSYVIFLIGELKLHIFFNNTNNSILISQQIVLVDNERMKLTLSKKGGDNNFVQLKFEDFFKRSSASNDAKFEKETLDIQVNFP